MHDIYVDGACVPNPGRMAVGYVINDKDGWEVARGGKRLGNGTNNQAEYKAALAGMAEAFKHGAKQVLIWTDSMLFCKQYHREYKIKNSMLAALMTQIRGLEGLFLSVDVAFASGGFERELTELAHDLAHEALRGEG